MKIWTGKIEGKTAQTKGNEYARVPDHTPVRRLHIVVALVDLVHLGNTLIERFLCPASMHPMSKV